MSNVPNGYKIGPRERELIKQLELLQRQGVALTPTGFCKRVGLAGTSSISRYKVLKPMLNDYGWMTQSDKMRGARMQHVVTPNLDDPRVSKLEAKIARLEGDLRAADLLKQEIRLVRTQLRQTRGVLMELVAQVTKADAVRAQQIEARLIELALAQTSERQLEEGDGIREYRTTTDFLDDIQKDWRAE